jgi:hypothetical protein
MQQLWMQRSEQKADRPLVTRPRRIERGVEVRGVHGVFIGSWARLVQPPDEMCRPDLPLKWRLIRDGSQTQGRIVRARAQRAG